ncbi:hypothetical protein NECAME_15430 [Necator americanus]|uniref:Uncharacterized protein n=1 Tax=Necator americanus TaxID=51031 RepID=W2SHZ4_NECAM|nr:hypothetical protein NECAME_15430 [Necator americanus]ETN69254.1 hypothetical protein NECAME_15430 [Necator americanus]
MALDSTIGIAVNRRTLPPRRRFISAPDAHCSATDDRKIIHLRRSSKTTSTSPTSKTLISRKCLLKTVIVAAQNQRQSPSMEGPDLHRFGDSPRSGSFNQSELYDDLIIDEILSLEDEQRRTSGKTQPFIYDS